MYEEGRVDTEDWCEVDFMSMLGEEESIRNEVNRIEEELITLNKAVGWYYQNK